MFDFGVESILLLDRIVIVSFSKDQIYGIHVLKRNRTTLQLTDKIQTIQSNNQPIRNFKFNKKKQILICNQAQNCFILSLKEDKLQIEKQFQTDFHQEWANQNDGLLNYYGTLLATGGNDGILRLWSIENQAKPLKTFKHNKKIISLDFHINDPLIIVVKADDECCIYNHENKNLIKKFPSQAFTQALFSLDERDIFTFFELKSQTYLSVWQINSQKPHTTLKVSHSKITCAQISVEGMYMGIANTRGDIKILNLRYLDIEAQQTTGNVKVEFISKLNNQILTMFHLHDPEKIAQIKCIQPTTMSFSSDSRYLLTGCSDGSYYYVHNVRPVGYFSKITRYGLILMFIVYIGNFVIQLFF